MKIGIYPGSFNPWHEGHTDILQKALRVFDKVIVAHFIDYSNLNHQALANFPRGAADPRVEVIDFFKNCLLVKRLEEENYFGACALIRGLRDGKDLDFEKSNQYWNEDLGLAIPIIYFICDRKLIHVSSSAIREIDKIKDHI